MNHDEKVVKHTTIGDYVFMKNMLPVNSRSTRLEVPCKNFSNSKENNSARVSFLLNLQADACNVIKGMLQR